MVLSVGDEPTVLGNLRLIGKRQAEAVQLA